jgi:5-bromo-4-chloroindolyl phosphate hydrolysis protein
MMTIETLAIAAPILVAVVVGLFGLATNYFDDKATAKRAATQAAGPDSTAGTALDREIAEARTGSRALLAAAVKQLDSLNRLEERSAAQKTSSLALEPAGDGAERR